MQDNTICQLEPSLVAGRGSQVKENDRGANPDAVFLQQQLPLALLRRLKHEQLELGARHRVRPNDKPLHSHTQKFNTFPANALPQA